MTIPADPSEKAYAGDGVSTVFAIPFPFDTAADLKLTSTDSGGNITTLTTGFTISGGGGSTGNATFSVAPASGVTITLYDDPARTQPTNYVSLDAFPAESHEKALDRVTRIAKRLSQLVQRQIRFPDGDPTTNGVLGSVADRKGKYLFFNAVTGAVEYAISIVGQALSQASIGALLSPRTPAEIAAGITPTAYFYVEGDARRYNALTAAADNSVAFNAALLVSANGGNAAFVPPSVVGYKHTSTLNAPSGSCMYGAGQASQLLPQTCDGITFGAQSGIAKSRFFRDFQILGATTGSNNGIKVNFTAASTNIVTGVEFDNLTIQNFGQGVFLRGLWQSQFRNCFLYNNYQGYYFHGQNVFNTIEGGFIQKGAITGAGTQIGINVDSIAGETCQSLHCIAAGVYAYDVLFTASSALYTLLENCDLSVANQIAVQLAATGGGFTMRDCWIQTNNAGFATVGIQLADLGGAVLDKIVIDNCTLVCNLANAGSQGIYVGTNQLGVTITNCTIGSATAPFVTGVISNGLAHNLIAKFNTIYASTTAIQLSSSGTDVEIGPNKIQNGTPIVFSAGTPVGFSYYARGSYTITLTGLTAVVTGIINWVANGHTVTLSIAAAGITGTSNATTMTGTGTPAYLWPVTDQWYAPNTVDSGVGNFGLSRIAAATGLITFGKDGGGAAFTATGTKGLNGGTTASYPYL